MHDGGGEGLDAEGCAGRHRAHLVVEAPDDAMRRRLVDEVPLHGLGRPIEHVPVSKGPAQLEVLGMGPHERPGRAGRLPDEQFALRNVGGIPDLLGQQTALAGERLERLRQLIGDVRAAGGELVVGALAGQERPRAPDAGSVERSAVGVLAVSVTLIAMPRRTARRVDLERRIDDLHGVDASADHRPRAVRSARRPARRG